MTDDELETLLPEVKRLRGMLQRGEAGEARVELENLLVRTFAGRAYLAAARRHLDERNAGRAEIAIRRARELAGDDTDMAEKLGELERRHADLPGLAPSPRSHE